LRKIGLIWFDWVGFTWIGAELAGRESRIRMRIRIRITIGIRIRRRRRSGGGSGSGGLWVELAGREAFLGLEEAGGNVAARLAAAKEFGERGKLQVRPERGANSRALLLLVALFGLPVLPADFSSPVFALDERPSNCSWRTS
jgi:hypothetical protein